MEKNNLTEKFCRSCGEKIKKEAVICPKCSVPQSEIKNKNKMHIAVKIFIIGSFSLLFLVITLVVIGTIVSEKEKAILKKEKEYTETILEAFYNKSVVQDLDVETAENEVLKEYNISKEELSSYFSEGIYFEFVAEKNRIIAEEIKYDLLENAIFPLEDAIKASLKSPTSYKLIDWRYSKVNNDLYNIEIIYDAQNSFGVEIRNTITANYNINTGKINIIE